ncbi:MAG: hypothetical protein ABIV06_08640 [Thermoanaerobaculia bacterium]
MKRITKGTLSLLILTLLFLAGPLAAGKMKGWELLGERRVSDGIDHDVIEVTATQGTFRNLKVVVRGHAVQFRSMRIHFANGSAQSVELRDVIPAGGESRVIDVEGADRVIRKVEFTYDAQTHHGKKALIRLFGRN